MRIDVVDLTAPQPHSHGPLDRLQVAIVELVLARAALQAADHRTAEALDHFLIRVILCQRGAGGRT